MFWFVFSSFFKVVTSSRERHFSGKSYYAFGEFLRYCEKPSSLIKGKCINDRTRVEIVAIHVSELRRGVLSAEENHEANIYPKLESFQPGYVASKT